MSTPVSVLILWPYVDVVFSAETEATPAEASKTEEVKETVEEKKKEKNQKDPKKEAKLARRLSARVFGLISPNKEKGKKEAELAAPAEVRLSHFLSSPLHAD